MKSPSSLSMPRLPDLFKAVWNYLLMGVLLAPSVLWIARDHSVWPWDQAWYAEVSVDSWFWFTRSPAEWVRTAVDALNMKPPGIVWLGQFFVPLHGLFGSIETSLLASILLTQFVLLVILFRIGRVLAPHSLLVPVGGVLFAAGARLFVGLSHQFLVEPLQAVAVAWTFLVAVKSPQWPKARIALHLGAALTLGALAKASTLMYCLLPCVWCGFVLVRRNRPWAIREEWRSPSFRALAVAAGCLGVATAAWYLRHLPQVWQHVRDASWGDVALDYGSRGSLLHKLPLWLRLTHQACLAPYHLWALVVAGLPATVLLVLHKTPVTDRQAGRLQKLALLTVLQIFTVLLIFSLNIAVQNRYLLAVVPCFAILFMQTCALIPDKLVAPALLVCCVQWAAVNSAALASTNTLLDQSNWLLPLHSDRSQYDELARVVHLTSNVPARSNMVAIEEDWINPNSAAFFAAKDRLNTGVRTYYVSLGYAQKNVGAAVKRIEDFQVRYVLTLGRAFQKTPPNFMNLTTLPVLELMEHDPRFRREAFASKNGLLVFRFNSSGAAAGFDPTMVPPDISNAKIENRGKSALDSVNGSLATRDGNGRRFVVWSGSLDSCDGWAFDDLQQSTPGRVWIELTGVGTGRHYYWPAQRYNRPELARAEKTPSVAMSGIRCQSVDYRLPAGVYQARVYQIDGEAAIVTDFSTYEPSPKIAVK